MTWVIVLLFVAILASLAFALGFLLPSRAGSRRTLDALTLRVGLSVLLFLLLMLAWYTGLMEPHGLRPLPGP